MNEMQKAPQPIKKYLLLFASYFVYSWITVCSKMAAMQTGLTAQFYLFLGLELLFLVLYAVIWQKVLKHFCLVSAIAGKGMVVILGLLWSMLLFQEHVHLNNVIGAVIIIAGIWVVAQDG